MGFIICVCNSEQSTWHVLCVLPMEIITIISLLWVCMLSVAGVCAYMCIFTFTLHSPPTVFFKAGSLPGLDSSISADGPVRLRVCLSLPCHCCDYKHMLRHPPFDMGSNSASCVCTASTLYWLSHLSSYIITILNYLNTINISSTHHAFSLRVK